jgi:phytoene synthase
MADKSTLSPGLELLSRDIRVDITRLYCVLRTLDDLVDEDHPQAALRVDAVERWVRGHQADTLETRTLADLSRRYPLSPQPLMEFCRGMRHDMARSTIDTEDDLERYCQQAGGSIGVMVAQFLGTTRPDGEVKIATLGRALQRTNILRDLDEDHAHGHVYIARTTIERFGFPTPGAREALLQDQIARADTLYEEGFSAIPLLCSGRRAASLSTALYREILRQIERDGYGRRPGRVTVPAWRVRLLIAKHRIRNIGLSDQ